MKKKKKTQFWQDGWLILNHSSEVFLLPIIGNQETNLIYSLRVFFPSGTIFIRKKEDLFVPKKTNYKRENIPFNVLEKHPNVTGFFFIIFFMRWVMVTGKKVLVFKFT